VSLSSPGWNTGQLYPSSARNTAKRSTYGGTCGSYRWSVHHTYRVDTYAYFNDSTSRGPSRSAERGVHAVCIQMDELLIDARDQCEEHHSDVGYISGTFFEPLLCGRGLI
jgi:hypothetical protein